MAHMREHSPRQPDDAQKVGIENAPGLFNRAFFRGGRRDPKARIIDQNIDPPLQAQQIVNSGPDRSIVSHIKRQQRKAVCTRLRATPAGAINLITRR